MKTSLRVITFLVILSMALAACGTRLQDRVFERKS